MSGTTGGVGGFGTDYSFGGGVIPPGSPFAPPVLSGTVGGIGNGSGDYSDVNTTGYNPFPDPDSPFVTTPDGTGVGTLQPGGSIAPVTAGSNSTLTSALNFLSELFLRFGVVTMGLILVLMALFFMFAQAAIHEYKAHPLVPV